MSILRASLNGQFYYEEHNIKEYATLHCLSYGNVHFSYQSWHHSCSLTAAEAQPSTAKLSKRNYLLLPALPTLFHCAMLPFLTIIGAEKYSQNYGHIWINH
jgi:hypothetical protein